MITKLKYVGVSTEDLLEIFIIFIRSVLEYCCVVWHSSLTLEQKDDLELVQLVCLKVILGDNCVDYYAALEMTGLEELPIRREAICLSFAQKCTKHPKHQHKFSLNNPMEQVVPTGHLYQLRGRELFTENFARSAHYQKSAIPYLQRLLNKHADKHNQPPQEFLSL